MQFNELWVADDIHGERVRCELNRATPTKPAEGDKTFYQISMTEGPFSGYPTIDLDRKQARTLLLALVNELCSTRAMLDLMIDLEVGEEKEKVVEEVTQNCPHCKFVLKESIVPGLRYCPTGHGRFYPDGTLARVSDAKHRVYR